MIRVLVVDDTATTRHLLIRLLSEGGQIEVVGQATNGKEAVELALRLQPDVITMDVVMPVMDGVAATAEIMRTNPTPIIIMSSLADIRTSPVSMEALNNGALAILALPVMATKNFNAFASHMRETVMAVSKIKPVKLDQRMRGSEKSYTPAGDPGRLAKNQKALQQILRGHGPVEIIAMAASVGGPAALATILGSLPADLPVPILVTQHISVGFTDNLALWLDHSAALNVRVASDFDQLAPNTVYIAPDNCHLGVRSRTRINVSATAPINGFRPAASFMFESVGKVFKDDSLAVILTGMGSDGVAGLKVQKANGAIVIAQNEATSVVYGMPKAAVDSGLADLVLPLDEIASTLVQIVSSSSGSGSGSYNYGGGKN